MYFGIATMAQESGINMNRHYVRLDFSDEAYATVQRLRDELNLPNSTEVIRHALSILIDLKKIVDAGGEIIEKASDGRQTIVDYNVFRSHRKSTKYGSKTGDNIKFREMGPTTEAPEP